MDWDGIIPLKEDRYRRLGMSITDERKKEVRFHVLLYWKISSSW